MIFMLIALAIVWFLFGRKALAWMIVIGAVAFAVAVFVAPAPWDCHDAPMITDQCK